MAKKLSVGILLYRRRKGKIQVFLVHPGGPFWAKKDEGAWSIPKGEYGEGEDPLLTAKREFFEETGANLTGACHALSPLKQPSGKMISAWAVEGDLDEKQVKSNTFSMEWPPHSGRMQKFPEVDRGAWFDLSSAKIKLLGGQRNFIDQLEQLVTHQSLEQ